MKKKREKDEKEKKKTKTEDFLARKVHGMIENLEKRIEDIDQQIGDKLNLLDRDGDGKISTSELREAIISHFKDFKSEEEVNFVVKRIQHLCEQGDKFFVSTEDLEEVRKELANRRSKEKKNTEKEKQSL